MPSKKQVDWKRVAVRQNALTELAYLALRNANPTLAMLYITNARSNYQDALSREKASKARKGGGKKA